MLASDRVVITSVIVDGEIIRVNWEPFSEPSLSGFIVTIYKVDIQLINFPVDGKDTTSRAIGYTLEAGAKYQCWVTPTITPQRVPDDAHASDIVPIPYPP